MSHWAMKMPSGRRRTAFTLLEVVVVMVIIGILSTLAVMSLSGTMDRYRLDRAIETVELFDARARRQASNRRAPVDATIHLQRNRLQIESSNGPAARVFSLPGGVEIASVRLSRKSVVGSELDLRYNQDGISPSYAVELKRGKHSRWLVVLGVSGQIVQLDGEREIDDILSF
ncbi:MAG: pilus assembly FimT family protein [Rubripirellula sp.]